MPAVGVLMTCALALPCGLARAQGHSPPSETDPQPVHAEAPDDTHAASEAGETEHGAEASGGEAHADSPSLFTGDIGNIIWSLLTFGAVIVVLGRFAWPPILDALKKREEFIRDSLQQAKQDRAEAEARLKEYSAKIDAARDEASHIVAEGRRDAEALRHKLEADARREAQAMLDRAKREIGIATETAVKELYDKSGVIATQIAARIIRKEVNAADHERLIRESIDELSRMN